MKTPPQIPEWLAGLPRDARVTTRDLFALFGYKSTSGLINAIWRGSPAFPVPEPDCHHTRFYWKAATIRNFIRRLIREKENASIR